jgi:hypothetical protein
MAVRKKPPPPDPAARTRLRSWLLPPGVAVLGGVLVLAGLLLAGWLTREAVRHDGRFTAAFLDTACDPPPGLDRTTFLSEVQYHANLPARLELLDDTLSRRLAEAFLRHPWVEEVEQVRVIPPGRIEARLHYRRPVLAVPVDDHLRAVDRHGVLLPPSAPTEGLPVFPGLARAPAGPAGMRWGDEAVEEAARRSQPAAGKHEP